jgi:hypothetical protein
MFYFLEFKYESECLLEETQLELQQYFMQFGYDFMFVDININADYDPFIDPYLFNHLLSEIDDASRISEACFFVVSFFSISSMSNEEMHFYANVSLKIRL